jgi:hypothetical protein
MPLVLAGATSGQATIQATDAATVTITLPATSGTLVTTGGAQTIEFADGSAAAPSITNSGDTNTGMFFPAADTIGFAEGGTEVMRIAGDGNNTFVNYSCNGLADAVQLYTGFSGTSSYLSIGTKNSGTLAERMRITSGGNVLIGTTSSTDTASVGARLFPGGSIKSTLADSTNAGSTLDVYSTGAGLYRFYIGLAGTVFATNTTISGISDQRVKENIVDLDVGLDAVMALKPRKFDWKAGKGKDIKGDRGFIAQEFEQVFPDMIDEWKDAAPEGEEPYKSVRADLIPILVKAVQELKATVDAQAARIAVLEGAK